MNFPFLIKEMNRKKVRLEYMQNITRTRGTQGINLEAFSSCKNSSVKQETDGITYKTQGRKDMEIEKTLEQKLQVHESVEREAEGTKHKTSHLKYTSLFSQINTRR